MSALATVIIPTYQHASFLPDALDSVLRQTYTPVEVIVVDDGSTDGTRDVVRAGYATVVYVHQQNQGLSAARNAGMARARGDVITFLDSDDLLAPAALERRVEALASHPDAGWVYSDLFVTDECGEIRQRCSELFGWSARRLDGMIFDELLLGNFIPIHAATFRRECVARAGAFDTTLRSAEDYEFLLRVARGSPATHLDEPLGSYRRRPESMSSDRLGMAQAMLRVMARLEHDYPEQVRARAAGWRRRKAEVMLQAALAPRARLTRWQRAGWALQALRARPLQRAAYRVLLQVATRSGAS